MIRSARVTSFSWRTPAIAFSLLALILAGFAAGIAVRGAMANSSNGVIHACKGERSGSVRIVEVSGDCLRGEVPISWNQAGVSGYELIQIQQTLNSGEYQGQGQLCPDGKRVLDVGVLHGTGNAANLNIRSIGAQQEGRGWYVAVQHTAQYGTDPITYSINVVCAHVSG